MLSGTYSSIFIATPVLADLKEREPQYQALAKRVAVRASGGRSAKRAAAKAQAGARPAAGTRGLSPAQLAEEAQDGPGFADENDEVTGTEPPPDELTTTASRAPRTSAGSVSAGSGRPGPRQQPRRGGGGARHRPAGKKKRR